MADGINSTVTVERSDGPRLRGTAAGIGTDLELEDVSHKELIEARRTGDIALVHSWELVTAVDGPGTRMTMFMAGCPLRCLYCHNPDTMQMKKGTLERVEDIIKKIKRYRRVFKASGGGLTISGGEPLFQIAFTRRVLKEVHDAGIHTTIDTSGYLGARLSDEDLENIDLVLLDVKAGDEETYRRVTGRELQPTIDFGNRLHAVGKPVWIRFVLVPGLTDSPENINKVADIVEQWKDNVERVEVLPFHNMGADKWHELNLQYDLEDVKPPTEESVAFTKNVFRSRGLLVP
ncbi:pyruvate formate lyase-activating protein [Corynebacterium pseudotuberculosis]|uniref:Pyruvate formate-lyase-activating enzyme n=2 Tax=Corynebacterium pseudotuberculosis TaxID=1719 RepID=D9QE24_CORP2|nr:pyruvate formate-lyase-activating protein [Corynebacterium pseudotuberculosis]AER68350.1 Pyruvate formate-lyase-activating enzyme [Corynebacterium pseudotuberculosis 1/06-A]ADK28042.1 pyruvate formate lyase-activating protein [Corynebacterium pseudotuberculosis FRC41]ADL09747.1 pyruvate formate lyase-activating protein [Corynebacterium pseudotuberculosis C231]ADL20153.1 pyruvate formate lyase-activating protein [Corynebacterium pseudotuberculosis 1002]ADO25542.1 pyruvate formate lyase-activ